MVGPRGALPSRQEAAAQPGEVVLEVEDVYAENDKGLPALRGFSLQVRAGEIVGLAGVAGNGQRELAEVITGLRQRHQGSVLLQRRGRSATSRSAHGHSTTAWRTSPRTAPTWAPRPT